MASKVEKNRIRKIIDAVEKASTGDRFVALDVSSRNDDLDLLASALNQFLGKVNPSGVFKELEEVVPDETEERIQNILDSIQESYFEVDLKGNLVFFNDRALRELGYDAKELQGMAFRYLVDSDTARMLYDTFHRVYRSCQPLRGFEWQVNIKDGRVIDVESSIGLLRDKNGRPCGFHGVARNITDRKHAERELRLSEEKYRTILDIMEEAYMECDLLGTITFVNDTACRFFGERQDNLIGASLRDYQPSEAADRMHQVFTRIYETGRPQLQVDYDLASNSGECRSYQLNAALKLDAAGNPCGFRLLIRDVTDRKKAQEDLRASESKYRSILENIQETYVETNLRGDFTFFNDAMCDLLGYSRNELRAMNYRDCVTPGGALQTYRIFNEIYRTNEKKDFIEHELIAKDGRRIIVHMSVSLIHSPAGHPAGFRGIARDVTDRIRSEQMIQASEKRLRMITESIRDVIWTMDLKKRYTYMSPAILSIFGYTADQFANLSFADYLKPASRAMVEKALTEEITRANAGQMQISDGHRRLELECIHKDGTTRWVEIKTDFNCDESGRPFEILGVTRDITDRRKAEEAIRESEKRYRMIVENMHDTITILDFNLQYLYQSPSEIRITGYTPEEIMKIPVKDQLTPESYVRAENILAEEMAKEFSGEPLDPNRSMTVELEVYHKNGSKVWQEVTASFSRDENGRPVGILLVGRNITQRKQAEQERDRLASQLLQAQKLETVGRLAGGVAHDFNNMLNVILGYADLAKLRLKPGDPIRTDLEEIEKAACRSRDLTAQLLAFSRKQIIAPRPVDLNWIINDTQNAISRLIGEDIDLRFYPGVDLWTIKFDPMQAEQILMNLAVNARDAMPFTGKCIIETSNVVIDSRFCREHIGFSPGEYVLLTVSDTGTGIDKDHLPYVFEPFFTTKEVGKGTGLGLATVYGIVQQNNGFILVHSEPGQGSTFQIYFPKTDEPIEVPASQPVLPVRSGAGTILLVEDDEMVLKMVTDMLQALDYTVIATDSPPEAISICEKGLQPIDLVITDVVMPVMSGGEMSKKLKICRPDLKLLFMSGHNADIIVHHGVLEEGVQFIQKPFSMSDLARKVKELISAA
jgi:PAS domain S-box-containing protein